MAQHPARTTTVWRGIASLGLGAFAIVSAEFLPVGMLGRIAGELHVSLGLASAIVLVPGLVAGLSAPFIVTLVHGMDRRTLVLGLTTVLLLSSGLAWAAPNFGVLLIARFLVGVALGGFWAVGPSLGVRLATPSQSKTATSIVLAGISAGTVLGLPVGQFVSTIAGWRTVFLGAALLAALVLLLQLLWLPLSSGAERVAVSDIVGVVRRRESRMALIATVVGFTGQLMAQTYVSVYLAQDVGLRSAAITAVLLAYGCAGLVGNLLVPRVRLPLPRVFAIAGTVVGIVFLCLPAAASIPIAAIGVVLVWGLLWGGVPFVLQSWTMSTTDQPEAGSAVLVTFLQLSIALGSATGGIAISFGGLAGTLVSAGLIELAGAAFVTAPLWRGLLSGRRPAPME